MRELLEDAAARAIAYLEQLPSRRVAPSEAAVAALAELDQPWPEAPQRPEETLQRLDALGSPAAMGMGSGRFFGFVIGGALPVTVASSWLATAWDQNTGHYASTPATAVIEQVALRWLLEALALPPGTAGACVTGATMANFSALAAARHAVLARAGWDVEGEELFGAPPITVLVSEEVHPTVLKAPRGGRAAGRRHLLVRHHRLAGAHGHAHQRLLLGHHGRRRDPLAGRHAAGDAAGTGAGCRDGLRRRPRLFACKRCHHFGQPHARAVEQRGQQARHAIHAVAQWVHEVGVKTTGRRLCTRA
jgi:hypothetical protein